MNKALEVKNLKISFRTNAGTLKAVRDISFDLEKGKTLAIVGESGSGKSVTSKAILGILAGNSIVEGGEILYDGLDLLKISEEEMCKIRGSRIAMIFQDPLSALNPIVRIGKQITEVMLVKNKGNRKRARKEFNDTLKVLKENMMAAQGNGNEEKKKTISEMTSLFDSFNVEAIKMENAYNTSFATAEELTAHIEDFLFKLEKKQIIDVKQVLGEYINKLPRVHNEFLTKGRDKDIDGYIANLKSARSSYVKPQKGQPAEVGTSTLNLLNSIKETLKELTSSDRPDFFRIGFYAIKNPGASLTEMPVKDFNEYCLRYLDDNFMKAFIELEETGLKYSYEKSLEARKAALKELKEGRAYYAGTFEKKAAYDLAGRLSETVDRSIDRLEINKDSAAYTFHSSLGAALDKYFYYEERNPKEEKRFDRQTAKRDALIAKGKTVDWKVVPKDVVELDSLRDQILMIFDNLISRYESQISAGAVDFEAKGIELIDYFKAKASEFVYKVTREMAEEKAIKLMEEVGIPEPRIRFRQYPFEFSGGMRQRIVIAIALAANPDILICDEPTTALDVTIQAQILDLINKLKKERNLTVIFITHDLGVVANMADSIAVMYAGKIVEYGTADEIFYDPRHPYTWALLSSMPDLDTKEKLDAIPGTPPNMIYPPVGDAFAERNKYALEIDFEMQPPKFEVSPTHWAATWLLHPDAPKVPVPKTITDRIARMRQKGNA